MGPQGERILKPEAIWILPIPAFQCDLRIALPLALPRKESVAMFKTLHPVKMAAFTALSFADLYLTYLLIQKSDGVIYEGNPIAGAWLDSYGWPGLATFKIVAMMLVGCVATVVSVQRPETAGRLLAFACCAVGFVVIYSCWLAGSCGIMDRRYGPTQGNKEAQVAFRSHRPAISMKPAIRVKLVSRVGNVTPQPLNDVPAIAIDSFANTIPVSSPLTNTPQLRQLGAGR